MQAASRESYAAALEQLNAQARGTGGGDLTRVGEELLAVAGLLAREPGLRRALADPSRPGEQRSALALSLLGDRVSATTGELVGTLTTGRWSTVHDLLDATELLGIEAFLASAERDGNLGEVEDALFRFRQVVAAEPALAAALGDTSAEVDRRRELVRQLLTGKTGPVAVRLAEVAVAGFGGRVFDAALIRLVELAAARRDRELAYVTVAAPLAESDEELLGTILSRMYGRDISVRLTVDPELVGGMRVQVGHDLYDGTVRRRLTDIYGAVVGGRR